MKKISVNADDMSLRDALDEERFVIHGMNLRSFNPPCCCCSHSLNNTSNIIDQKLSWSPQISKISMSFTGKIKKV